MNQLTDISALYEDTKACAKLVGLSYIEQEDIGFTRQKRGKGFTFLDDTGKPISESAIKERIAQLVIPPAWQEVWICPDDKGHILATGIDEKGRKQYLYHPKWRTMRDLIKFYRMIIFARALPKIRRTIDKDLSRSTIDRDKVIGVMLWLLDNTYLRIGNETYFTENDSVGLTTLSDKNLVVAGPVITLSFRGKSGKDHQITFENKQIATIIEQLITHRGARLFRYSVGTAHVNIEASHINSYLHEITGEHISAKDFRTWGGTLMAFNHLVVTARKPAKKTPKPEKIVIEAVDAAANVLGNTRTVAKSSYVHPDILSTYSEKNFHTYYQAAQKKRTIPGLDKRETELLSFLEQLFEEEFDLLQDNKKA
jgi:DNA topoisomerase I